jgi:hypothetical protein
MVCAWPNTFLLLCCPLDVAMLLLQTANLRSAPTKAKMGGGAPLAFLNKKTWHPGRMQNLEEVWKREQAAAAEQRKLEELRKQYEDERKNAEFTQMAENAGYK